MKSDARATWYQTVSRSHCPKIRLDILRPPLINPGEKVTWKLCPREGASID